MTLKSKATAGVRWTTLAAAVNTGFRLLQLVVLAHFLSPDDFGLMAIVWIIIGFIQEYTDLGISSAIIHRQDATKDQLSTLYWLNILAGLCAFILVWLSTPLLVHFFNEIKLAKLLHGIALVFLINPWGTQFSILLQKELKFNFLAIQEMCATIAGVSCAILCAISGLGVWSLIRPNFRFCRSDLKGYLNFGLYQIGERSVNYISERMDQLLIGSILGVNSLGYYNFAFNLVIQPVIRINPIVTRVAFPVFSKVQNDTNRLKAGYIKVINLLTSINAPIFFGLAMAAPVAIPIVFGEKWNSSILLVQILSFVALFRSIGNPIGSLQLAKGRPDLGFKWNILLLVVTFPTIYLGGKFGGVVGVAVSLLCLQILMQVLEYLYLVRSLIEKCAKEYFGAILKPIFFAAEMIFWVIGASFVFNSAPPMLFLIIQITLGLISYILLFWLQDKKTVIEIQSMIRPKYQ